jgi:hypothetical protein
MGNTDSSIERTWVVEYFSTFSNKWTRSVDLDKYYTEYEGLDSIKHFKNKNPRNILEYRLRDTTPVIKSSSTVKGDMKEGLTNGKPQLSQLPQAGLVYTARAFEYGCSPTKYERGNYLRPTLDTLADFDRLLSYLDALLRHATKITTEMNRARGCTDQTETDLRAAAMCIDKESGLPHLCGMMASGMMAIQQAVDAGLIPADPGRPWEKLPKAKVV